MSMTKLVLIAVVGLGLAAVTLGVTYGNDPSPAATLRDVGEFDSIEDAEERSKALFLEIGRVLHHPRCLNCHPSDEHPRAGDDMAFHLPPVTRGDEGHGTPAMRCNTCHQAENIEHAMLPGHPSWRLAPLEMGWMEESLHSICEQIKDGMSLEALHEHMASDPLVGWAWAPGPGREPAPGTQAAFAELVRAWIESGAHCPDCEKGKAAGPEPPMSVDCSSCHDR